MDQETNRSIWKEALFLLVGGVLFSRLEAGSLIFTIPLLFLAQRIKKTSTAVLMVLAGGFAVVVWNLIDFKEFLFKSQYFGILGFSLFFPVCLIIVAAVWTGLRDFSNLVLRKFVICSIPVLVIGLSFALWLLSPAGSDSLAFFEAYTKQAMNQLSSIFPESLTGQFDVDALVKIFINIFVVAIAPIGVVLGAIPVMISELMMHRFDEEWQDDFCNMGMPPVFVWPTLACWIAVLSGILFASYPKWLAVLLWNVTFCLTLHYLLAGLSIVCARARKKTPEIRVSKICLIFFVMSLLPGSNMIVFAVLPILGILETWLKMR